MPLRIINIRGDAPLTLPRASAMLCGLPRRQLCETLFYFCETLWPKKSRSDVSYDSQLTALPRSIVLNAAKSSPGVSRSPSFTVVFNHDWSPMMAMRSTFL